MKWYRKEHRDKFYADLKATLKLISKEERHVLKYHPLALKFARKTNCEEQKVGILNVQDIEQIAMYALQQAWNAVDWEKIENKENAEKSLINYLSSNIDGRIKRTILAEATGVSTPEYIITRSKKEMLADALFGNWLYSFRIDDSHGKTNNQKTYMDIIEWRDGSSRWENDLLNDKLTDIMLPLRQTERDIIMWSFGIYENLTSRQIGDRLDMTPSAVRKSLERALKKLDTEENREYLKKYL